MAYTPTKGSPQPKVPGSNVIELVLTKLESIASNIPAGSAIASDVQEVIAIAQLGVNAIDPSGMKASERTAELNAAQVKTQSSDPATVAEGVTEANAFAQDIPARPTPWVRWARWIPVQVGRTDPLPGGP